MLVLTRKESEKIWIGDFSITVTKIRPGQVKLGIEAPREVPVVRGELRVAPEPPQQQEAA